MQLDTWILHNCCCGITPSAAAAQHGPGVRETPQRDACITANKATATAAAAGSAVGTTPQEIRPGQYTHLAAAWPAEAAAGTPKTAAAAAAARPCQASSGLAPGGRSCAAYGSDCHRTADVD